MQTVTKVATAKQKLIKKINEHGGIAANRKALKSLQDSFAEKVNAKNTRLQAWK
jgi:DNA-binding transcriptional regulator YiaG